MNYKIIPTKEFEKDFYKLDKNLQKRIINKINEVAKGPERYKQLHYDLKGSSRIRIGKLRIVYSYDSKKQEIYLEKVILKHKY